MSRGNEGISEDIIKGIIAEYNEMMILIESPRKGNAIVSNSRSGSRRARQVAEVTQQQSTMITWKSLE
jgi:hypothetical protein